MIANFESVIQRIANKRNRVLDFGIGARFRSHLRMSLKIQLEKLVREMYLSGITYKRAVKVFQTCFIGTVLRENNGNQLRAARGLGMHRNTLKRDIGKLELDINDFRSRRRPPKSDKSEQRPSLVTKPS
jgi:transcriptional regulator with GAF, ATPase, and Fis domain